MFRSCIILLVSVLASFVLAGRVLAQQATVLMNASPSVILADGRSSTTVTATISGLNADQVPDGTIVRFTTTAGILSADAVSSVGGIARVTLTSSPTPGYATITATFVGTNGSGNGNFKVEFTGDKTLANTDTGDSDWIRVSSSDYMAYSADSEVVDASAAKQGVQLSYRGLVIAADAMQVDFTNGSIRARNVTVQRGHHDEKLLMLHYNVTSGQGEGLSDSIPGSRTVQPVSFTGRTLTVQAIANSDIPQGDFTFVDISSSRVVVTATAVAVRLNDRIQFKHASIFVDSKHIVSMPYHMMPLSTTDIFGQQVFGYGSDGLFLDVPYYTGVSPKATGAFYLRSTTAAQQDGTYYSGRQGLSVDYVEKYGSFDGKTTGSFNVMGITRGDWGASWTHSEQFTNSLRGYFYLDVPEHNSLFASSNLTQLFKGFSLNFTSTDTKSAVIQGYSSNQQMVQTYLQADAHRLVGTKREGLYYSNGVTLQDTLIRSEVAGRQSSNSWLSTRSAGVNLYTTPFRLSSSTQLTDSANISQASANRGVQSGTTATAGATLNTKFGTLATSSLGYTFSHDPVTGNELSNSFLPVQFRPVANQSNYSFLFNLTPKDTRWSSFLSSTYSQPLGDTSVTTGLTFYPSSSWILGVTENYSTFDNIAYRDLEFSISRRIGSREIQLYWSSVDDRFRFDMGTAQF